MKVEKLIYFIELYKYKNYTKVAQRNYISQTSLTQYINSLEDEFGVKLFDRRTQPITPTLAGDRFYKEACVFVRQYQNLKETMKNMGAHYRDFLRIKYTSQIDLQLMGSYYEQFKQSHPDITVELSATSFSSAAASLAAMESDVVVGVNLDLEPSEEIQISVLYEGEFCAVVGSNHPLYHEEDITCEVMYKYPLILLSERVVGSRAYNLMIERCAVDGFYPNIQKNAEDIETILFCVSTENLMAFFPDIFLLGRYEGTLKKLSMKNSPHTYKMIVGYAAQNSAAEEFLKGFRHYLQK